ncbi:hypothetical protein IAU60_004248 [Kwoniella sp. DSM 27419]
MAELTPPPSHDNTPVRPSDNDEPLSSSPTRVAGVSNPPSGLDTTQPHPLASSTLMDLDPNESYASSSDAELQEGVPTDIEDEDEGEGVSVRHGDDHGAVSPDDDEEDMSRAKVGSPTGADRKRKATRSGGSFTKLAGSSMTDSHGLRRREMDLYDSEIVARWNQDFGDVCAVRKATEPVRAVTASEAPSQNAAPAA